MCATLAQLVGQAVLLKAFRELDTAWHFKHSTPWDMMYFLDAHLEPDLTAFWKRWLFEVPEENR